MAYKIDRNAEFRERAVAEGFELPSDTRISVEMLPTQTRYRGFDAVGSRYGGEPARYTARGHGVATLNREDVRTICKMCRDTRRNWRMISSIDAALGLTAHGEMLEDVGFDTVFLNLARRRGVEAQQILQIFRDRIISLGGDIISQVRTSFTNLRSGELELTFQRRYRNMEYVRRDEAIRSLPPFQGSIWGKKAFAFDVALGDWTYVSSERPNLISRRSLPEASLGSLKGRKVNEIVEGNHFGDDQTIIHAGRISNGGTQISMTPSVVALGSFAAMPVRKAA